MSRRWQWDFEEHPGATRVAEPAQGASAAEADQAATPDGPEAAPRAQAASSPAGEQPAQVRRAQLRRRRAGAVLVVVVLLALVLALASSQGSHHRGAAAAARGAGAARVPLGQTGAPAADADKTVSATLAFTPFVKEGTRGVRDVALTFDDGPGPYTPGVLEVLEREHVQTTFFSIGRMERYFGDSTSRELRDGDIVGDHTQSHQPLALLPPREQREQILEGMARIELLSGRRPRLFRPPYGSFNNSTMRQLHSLGLLMVLWSVDTGDYQQPGVAAIVQRALAGVHPGGIVLMHDGGGVRAQTIAALPIIIHELHARGYRLVTVPQLLVDDPPPRGLPLPASLAGD